MPLPNRVDPFGAVRADPARGLFTGNRGVIHDPDTRRLLGRRWTTRAWLVCRLDMPGRSRDVMGRNAPSGGAGWTELFFLDEVTALAAGHRPCFFCRRDHASAFARAFREGNGLGCLRAAQMDARLHGERQAATGAAPLPLAGGVEDLPDGAMLADEARVFAKRGSRMFPWSFAGYGEPVAMRRLGQRQWGLVTPASTVAALRAGYRPVWHPSAGAQAPVSASPAPTGLDSGEPR